MSSSSRHDGPSWVYAFHAAISYSAAVAAIASSAAGSSPIVGVAWPWMRTWPTQPSCSTWRRARSITSVDSGSGSATTGIADSTATAVSLPPRTRSSQASIPMHAAGSSPHDACGKPSPQPSSVPGSYSRRWVWTSTTSSLPASTVVAAASSIVDSGGSENVPPVPGTVSLDRVPAGCVSRDAVDPGPVGGGAREVVVAASSLLHAARAVNVAAIPQLDRRNARRDIPSRRALVSATVERAPDRLGDQLRARQRRVLAVRQRVEGERQAGLVRRVAGSCSRS